MPNRIFISIILFLLSLVLCSKPVAAQTLTSQIAVPLTSESAPVKVITTIANLSNNQITPKGFLMVFDMFGNLISQTKIEEVAINPKLTQTYENLVGNALLPGLYKLRLSTSDNNSETITQASASFWIIPWKTFFPLIFIIAIILLLIFNWEKKIFDTQKELQKRLKQEEEEIKKLKEKLRKNLD